MGIKIRRIIGASFGELFQKSKGDKEIIEWKNKNSGSKKKNT